jgi:hypothetical protein
LHFSGNPWTAACQAGFKKSYSQAQFSQDKWTRQISGLALFSKLIVKVEMLNRFLPRNFRCRSHGGLKQEQGRPWRYFLTGGKNGFDAGCLHHFLRCLYL